MSVLVIEVGEPWRPGFTAFHAAFRETLYEAVPEPVALYAENLDVLRLGLTESIEVQQAQRSMLRLKYGGVRLGAIVAAGPAALQPTLRWRTELWPDVPLVLLAPAAAVARLGRVAGTTALTFEFAVAESLRAALALLPDTRRVALVAANDPQTRALSADLSAAFGTRLEWLDLTGLAMAELSRRVAALPERTVIFYTDLPRDGAGQAWTGRQALTAFAPHANRPIFSIFGPYLGYGVVGGSLLSFETLGRETAQVVARILRGEPPASIPTRPIAANALQFDWVQLQRWGLDERRVPPGSQIVNRQPSVWEQHRGAVLVTLGVLVAQGLLIGGLLVERWRRRRAEMDLQRLSGRLLTAQEEERRRIARDLHDDVGQRLALLAIEAEQLRAPPPGSPDGLDDRARDLATKAQGLASDIHRIAYELHPARLEHLGFPAAVGRLVEELRVRHGLAVTLVESDWPRDVSPDVALCLYRVTQEALRNVVRHSGAREARVVLEGQPDHLTVTVSDAGVGFEAGARPPDRGLGLTGMRERLRFVGGTLAVDATPGRGTRIRARVARGASPAARLDAASTPGHAEASRPLG